MKLIFLIIFCLANCALGAQPRQETFGYTRQPPMPDSLWNTLTVRKKIDYCLHNADQYRQICGRYIQPPSLETRKFIYPGNYHFNSFAEYVYSKRQLDYLTAHLDSAEAYLEEDLFLNKSGLYYWDYLLRQLPARREIIDLLLNYWHIQETATSEPLNLIVSMMIRDGFDEFMESAIYKVLINSPGKIKYNDNNRMQLGALIDEYMKSGHVTNRAHWNRISDSQIFSATTDKDSVYAKTWKLNDARLNSLSALPLLNYCIFRPEKYLQICSNAGSLRRDHRRYIYTYSGMGDIDENSYSQRQKTALLKKQDSCQTLLMELLQAGNFQEGLILLTNTWQAIPWLIKHHRMYGKLSGGYITTLLGLLRQNKGTGFDGFFFKREALTAAYPHAGAIIKTPAAEKAILNFAMELYRKKTGQ